MVRCWRPQPTSNHVYSALFSLQIARQILEAHSSMLNMSLMDAKMQYIRNWQALTDFGITYFIVRVGRARKDVSDCGDDTPTLNCR